MSRFFIIAYILLLNPFNVKAEVFVGYDSFCNLPVVVGSDQQTATARTDGNGNKFIHVDPGVMNNWTTSRMFVLAHECAHHLLGHTSNLGQAERYYGGTTKQELEADCWAAKSLQSIGNTQDISRTILEQASKGHFAGGNYPSGYQRAQNILACVGDEPRSCSYETESCNHAAHANGDRTSCSHIVSQHPQGDMGPCQHVCQGQFGLIPCHPNGDVYQCSHATQMHQFDVVACNHAAHPNGHAVKVCY
jgi:hypothetical protein